MSLEELDKLPDQQIVDVAPSHILRDILNGTYTIIKTFDKPTSQEQLAIDYAKACGYKWIAKDGDGIVFAYGDKPNRVDDLELWDYQWEDYMQIKIPISFISWDDKEPYYIGDD